MSLGIEVDIAAKVGQNDVPKYFDYMNLIVVIIFIMELAVACWQVQVSLPDRQSPSRIFITESLEFIRSLRGPKCLDALGPGALQAMQLLLSESWGQLGDNCTFDFWLAASQVNITANGIFKFVCGGDWLWNFFDVIIVALQPGPHWSRCVLQGFAYQISVERERESTPVCILIIHYIII